MDKQQFSDHVREMSRGLYCVARTYLPACDCGDAVQDALLKAWDKRDTLRNEEYFKTWLTRILINTCKQELRRKKRLSPTDCLPEEISPEEEADPLLHDLLFSLDKKYRLMLVLFYRDRCTVEEISRITLLPQGTIKSRLARARNMLKKQYVSEEGGALNG